MENNSCVTATVCCRYLPLACSGSDQHVTSSIEVFQCGEDPTKRALVRRAIGHHLATKRRELERITADE